MARVGGEGGGVRTGTRLHTNYTGHVVPECVGGVTHLLELVVFHLDLGVVLDALFGIVLSNQTVVLCQQSRALLRAAQVTWTHSASHHTIPHHTTPHTTSHHITPHHTPHHITSHHLTSFSLCSQHARRSHATHHMQRLQTHTYTYLHTHPPTCAHVHNGPHMDSTTHFLQASLLLLQR